MRKFFISAALVILVLLWARNFVGNGQFQELLDKYGTPSINAPIEYYWGALLELSSRNTSALYRFNRVKKNYPKSLYRADAWAEYINIHDEMGHRDIVLDEGKKFLSEYPHHEKSDLIQKKIDVIEHGI